jgi:pSer/pThr/pTyr-binding forkhead associated (FHA) protein
LSGETREHLQAGDTRKFYRKKKKEARAQVPLRILVVVEGPDKDREFILLPCQMRIGRHPDNHIYLSDSLVSRRHAVLDYDRKLRKYLLVDLQSTNGTYLNDRRIEKGFLSPGDRIRVGGSVLEFINPCAKGHEIGP